MAEMDAVDLLKAAHPLLIHDPELIPAARYYDQDFYDLEVENLWPHVWQMACRLEQIPNVGDWIEYSNVGKSVIVVRTRDGVKAHQNHCRHRGGWSGHAVPQFLRQGTTGVVRPFQGAAPARRPRSPSRLGRHGRRRRPFQPD